MSQLVSDVASLLGGNSDKANASARKKILEQMAADERSKTNLVKKALAKQRAAYGAAGMTGKGMTEDAVLKRLREETEEPFDDKKRTNQGRLSSLKKPAKKNLIQVFLSQFDKIMG